MSFQTKSTGNGEFTIAWKELVKHLRNYALSVNYLVQAGEVTDAEIKQAIDAKTNFTVFNAEVYLNVVLIWVSRTCSTL